jgi:hypothetical protein
VPIACEALHQLWTKLAATKCQWEWLQQLAWYRSPQTRSPLVASEMNKRMNRPLRTFSRTNQSPSKRDQSHTVATTPIPSCGVHFHEQRSLLANSKPNDASDESMLLNSRDQPPKLGYVRNSSIIVPRNNNANQLVPRLYVPSEFTMRPLDPSRNVYILNPRIIKGRCPKFATLWAGPYHIIEQVSERLYRIRVGGRVPIRVVNRANIYQP